MKNPTLLHMRAGATTDRRIDDAPKGLEVVSSAENDLSSATSEFVRGLIEDDGGGSDLDIDPPEPESEVEHVIAEDYTATRGHIKIFPPTFQSVAEIPEDWKKENWTKPSPWCSIEGMQNHVDFEKNLTTLEAQ